MRRPCVFLDRDGVINRKPPTGSYVRVWSDFHLIPSIVDWIRIFNAQGYLVVVVTNQRGIARGLVTLEELKQLHARMVEELGACGARIDDVLFCPHHADSCDCRKPFPGMIDAAAAKWGIDLDRSLVIGDSESDRGLAEARGLPFVQVRDGKVVDTAGHRDATAPPSRPTASSEATGRS